MQVGSLDSVPVLLHADPDGGAAGDVHPRHRPARVGVRRADHRGAVHPARRSPAPRRRSGRTRIDGEIRLTVDDVQLPRRRSACAAGCFADGTARHDDGGRRVHGVGQVDAGIADLPDVRRHSRIGTRRRRRRPRLRHRAALVVDRVGTAARLPVLAARSPTICATARPTRRTTRCGRRCGSPPPTISSAPTPTASTCGSRRAASTSPAVSGSGWRSHGPSSDRPAIYLFDDAFSALDVHTDARVRAALS